MKEVAKGDHERGITSQTEARTIMNKDPYHRARGCHLAQYGTLALRALLAPEDLVMEIR